MTRTFLPHVITDDSALGGAVIERSLRFSATASPKLTRTYGTTQVIQQKLYLFG